MYSEFVKMPDQGKYEMMLRTSEQPKELFKKYATADKSLFNGVSKLSKRLKKLSKTDLECVM